MNSKDYTYLDASNPDKIQLCYGKKSCANNPLFDEPEAALSPQRQLSVLTLMHRLVLQHSQLVIATHSPILLGYPHAWIFEFGEWGIRRVRYEDTEHFQITRDFLNRHERMLEILLEGD